MLSAARRVASQIEGLADIGRAAHARPRPVGIFTGSDSPVSADWSSTADALGHRAVDRHHVAPADQQPVAGLEQFEGDLLQLAVPVPDGRARHPRQQRGHLATGRLLGEALEVLAAAIHQGHDGRGEALAEDQRRCHRQGRDDVEPDIAAPQAGHNLDEERRSTGSVAAVQIDLAQSP